MDLFSSPFIIITTRCSHSHNEEKFDNGKTTINVPKYKIKHLKTNNNSNNNFNTKRVPKIAELRLDDDSDRTYDNLTERRKQLIE